MNRLTKVTETELNPIPFASDTRYRLVALAVFIVTVTFGLGLSASSGILQDPEAPLNIIQEVIKPVVGELFGELSPRGDETSNDTDRNRIKKFDVTPYVAEFHDNMELRGGLKTLWLPMGLTVLFLMTACLFRGISTWRILHRRDVRPLDGVVQNQVVELVSDVAARLGLKETPALYWAARLDDSAMVFGSDTAPRLLLNSGNRRQMHQDVESMRVVIGHECAHIVNRDVGSAIWARSLWSAYCWIVVPAFLGSVMVDAMQTPHFTIEDGVSMVVRLIVASLVIFIARNAVFRSREYYADHTAATALNLQGELEARLTRSSQDRKPSNKVADSTIALGSTPHWRRWFTDVLQGTGEIWGIFSEHPTHTQRLSALKSSNQLFTPPTWSVFGYFYAFGTCVLIWFAGCALTALTLEPEASPLALGLTAVLFLGLLLIFSVVLTGAIGTALWRATVADCVLRPTNRFGALQTTVVPALLAAAGSYAGMATSVLGAPLFLYFGGAPPSAPDIVTVSLWQTAGLLVLLFSVFLALFIGSRRLARAWAIRLAKHARGAWLTPRLVMAGALQFGFVVPVTLVMVFLIAAVVVLMSTMIEQSVFEMIPISATYASILLLLFLLFFVVIANPLLIPGILITGLGPLLAGLIGSSDRKQYAAWIVHRGDPAAHIDTSRLRPLLAIGIGLLAGVVLIAVYIPVLRAALQVVTTEGTQLPGVQNEHLLVTLFVAFLALSSLLVSFLVSLLTRSFRFEHGLTVGMISALTFTVYWIFFQGNSEGAVDGWIQIMSIQLVAAIFSPIGAVLGALIAASLASLKNGSSILKHS